MYKTIFSIFLCNFIEWFDFILYGHMSYIFSKLFFANYTSEVAALLSLGIFAAAFIARPFGALIFGYIGDKYNKKLAVDYSIFLMAVSTFLIGLLPSYSSTGLFSTILLILLRLIQGISTGGQFSGILTIISESTSINKTFAVGLVNSIALMGLLFASGIGVSVEKLIAAIPSLNILEWRIPFLFSGILYVVYYSGLKTFNINLHKIMTKNSSLSTYIKSHMSELIYATLIGLSLGGLYYIFFVYFHTYMQLHLGLNNYLSSQIMNIVILFCSFNFIFLGLLSNKIHYRILFAKYLIIISIFCLMFMYFYESYKYIFIVSFIMLLIMFCEIVICTNTVFADLFSPDHKMMACALTYDLGVSLSGVFPLICEYLNSLYSSGTHFVIIVIYLTFLFSTMMILKTNGYKRATSNGIRI